MATVVTDVVSTSGTEAAVNSASGGAGDKVVPDSLIRVINGSASPVTMTMVTPQVVDGDLAVADRTVIVPAGEHRYVRAARLYRNRSDNLVALTWSATADVSFEVIA